MAFIFEHIEKIENSGKYEYLSGGGESKVYKNLENPEEVYKVYTYYAEHNFERRARLEKLKELANVLPSNVVTPTEIINEDGITLGYKMRNIENAEPLRICILKNEKSIIEKLKLVIDIGETIKKVHENKLVIGDFSTNNILVNKDTGKIYFIDTDSWGVQDVIHVAGVTRKQYTDPRCFNKLRVYNPKKVSMESNWYTFAIISLEVLLGEYPNAMVIDELDFELDNILDDNTICAYQSVLMHFSKQDILSLLKLELQTKLKKLQSGKMVKNNV